MIKSAKQLSITKAKLDELIATKKEKIKKNKDDINSFKYKLMINSIDKLINDLETEISEYENLIKNKNHTLISNSIEDLPELLIKSRIAKKMTQKDLAKLLGIDNQQIQRYEATNYESASWVRIVDVILAMDLDIKLKDLGINDSENDCQFHLSDETKKAQASICRQGLFPINTN
jgi:HTH-type transcriptional regulator/antitoxin HipB